MWKVVIVPRSRERLPAAEPRRFGEAWSPSRAYSQRSPSAGNREEQRRYFLLLTAYPVEQEHRRKKLREEYEAWAQAHPTKG